MAGRVLQVCGPIPDGPLRGIRVIDRSGLRGAGCARFLAQLGAEVRRYGPLWEASLPASFAWFYGSGGRAGGASARPLSPRETDEGIGGADILLDAPVAAQRAAGGAANTRAAWRELRARHPALIVVALSPFGLQGPRSGWEGGELVCAAAGGMVLVNGEPGGVPLAPFGRQAHHAAGIWGAIAALLALRVRERTGRGQLIDVSIAAAATAMLEHATGILRQEGRERPRTGTLHWNRHFRIGPCRDGEILHCTLGDWETLARWAVDEGGPPLLAESSLADARTRQVRAEELFEALDAWSRVQSVEHVAEGARLRRLPIAAVASPETLGAHPQLRARGLVVPARPSDPINLMPLARLTPTPAPSRDPTGESAGRRRPAPDRAGARALDGVRVLDLTWVVAGPVASRTLADQGADVVKLERRDATDFGDRRGGLSGNLNRGKRSIVVDLSGEEGRQVARALALRSDVVIDNFSPRVMEQVGLDHATLTRENPGLISVRMSGFGLTGPWRDDVSYGPTLQAMVGLPRLMRHADGPSLGWGYSFSDMAAGTVGALLTLAALRHRDATGEGMLVDLGQFDVLVTLLGPALDDLLRGRSIPPSANRSQEGTAVPHGVFRAACAARRDAPPALGEAPGDVNPRRDGSDDRWIAITVGDDAQWRVLADCLAGDGEAWASDPSLGTLAGRVAHEPEIEQRIGAWTRRFRAEELAARLQARGVPAAPLASANDLCAPDPQLAARGYFAHLPTPEARWVDLDGIPFLADDWPGRGAAPRPRRGEHTDAVLREWLDASDDDLARWRNRGGIV